MNQANILLQELVKSRNRKIPVYSFQIVMEL